MTPTAGQAAARPDPAVAQRRAADPQRSVWVSASAGTGKTKVLTDRVLSLLLAGTPPHRILCLTFTRAAAAEMANRINGALARWAVASDVDLGKEIDALVGAPPDAAMLRRARPLFARVLDVPGGMKIQTIHAFCESLLGRFPLEAGLAPHFEVMDERDAALLQDEAQKRVLARARVDAANGDGDGLAAALERVSCLVGEAEFRDLLVALAAARGDLRRLLDRHGGLDALVDTTCARLGVARDDTEDAVVRAACEDGACDVEALRSAALAMAGGAKTDRELGAALASWLALGAAARADGWTDYLDCFYRRSDGKPRARLMTKAVADAFPAEHAALRREAERVEAVCENLRAVVTAQATACLLRLAQALLAAYEDCKRELGRLDYDDLILRARRLLEADGSASWVLFKLDGGIDHILIDEAQDTNPDQWAVVRALAEEFFAGLGAREMQRTVFAVGDPKQSIYGFQRAAPDEFERMRGHFRTRVAAAERQWDDVDLEISFRSTASVLRAVDAVFARPAARDGLAGPDHEIRHEPFRQGAAGLVELWPPVSPEARDDPDPWEAPIVARRADQPQARLAAVIAGRIRRWLDKGERLESRGRPVRPGDIMVLVRRRGRFVEELVRALKQRNVPVAGVDRMVLGEQLAVRDLIALGNFLLLPEDDLTLATVLKGPLFGLDEDALFALAWGRERRSLWQVLRGRARERPDFAAAAAELAALLARVDFAPPYELFAGVLARRGRCRIAGRLGLDANDPLDEFLARALAFERSHPPSLQAFLHAVERDAMQIKRDLEQATRNEVRVMTVHGSKGLQAPIVFLPDTLQTPRQRPALLWDEDGLLLWPPRARFVEKIGEAAIRRAVLSRDREHRRLLYVAMTRAEDRLYVCGWNTRTKPPADNWYELVAAAMEEAGEPFEADLRADSPAGWTGPGRRMANPQEAPIQIEREMRPDAASIAPLPGWAERRPPPEAVPPRPLAPSRPGEDEPAPRSPLGADGGAGFRRGLLIHRLLQILPEIPRETREAAARRFLARPVHGLDAAAQETLAREVLTVLDDPALAPLYATGSRAEVPIVGRIGERIVAGQVDRLCVGEDSVRIVDYKTNRPPPRTAGEVAPLYLRQMAAYRAVLREIYPKRPIHCALLWTDGPFLMALPDELLNLWMP